MATFVNVQVTDAEGRVLECWYERSQKWGLPGFSLEHSEAPEVVAKRALQERAGYDAPSDEFTIASRSAQGGTTTYVLSCPFDVLQKIGEPKSGGEIRWMK
jgi:ADP-ribose pyrophosphatase YjhB (NUDIX family)